MDWSETIRAAIAIAGVRSSLTLDQLNSLVPMRAKPEDVEALLTALCDRGIWLTDESASGMP